MMAKIRRLCFGSLCIIFVVLVFGIRVNSTVIIDNVVEIAELYSSDEHSGSHFSVPEGWHRIEENDPSVSLYGRWVAEYIHDEYSQDRSVYVNYWNNPDPDAYAVVEFEGVAIVWHGARTYNAGRVRWVIDEGTDGEVSGEFSTHISGVVRFSTEFLADLCPGSHILKFIPIFEALPCEIYIDCFDVKYAVPLDKVVVEPESVIVSPGGEEVPFNAKVISFGSDGEDPPDDPDPNDEDITDSLSQHIRWELTLPEDEEGNKINIGTLSDDTPGDNTITGRSITFTPTENPANVGTGTLTATVCGQVSASARITVGLLHYIKVFPDPAEVVGEGSIQFIAKGYGFGENGERDGDPDPITYAPPGDDTGPEDIDVTWTSSLTEDVGRIDPNTGLLTTEHIGGKGTVTATYTNEETLADSADITVYGIDYLKVTPNPEVVPLGDTREFTAKGYSYGENGVEDGVDEEGNPLGDDKGPIDLKDEDLTWTLSGKIEYIDPETGEDNIDDNGVFTAVEELAEQEGEIVGHVVATLIKSEKVNGNAKGTIALPLRIYLDPSIHASASTIEAIFKGAGIEKIEFVGTAFSEEEIKYNEVNVFNRSIGQKPIAGLPEAGTAKHGNDNLIVDRELIFTWATVFKPEYLSAIDNIATFTAAHEITHWFCGGGHVKGEYVMTKSLDNVLHLLKENIFPLFYSRTAHKLRKKLGWE